jgi:hypothetical protein
MQKQPQDGRALFMLPEGEHTARITWSDAAGNHYSRDELVRARENSVLGIQIPAPSQPSSGRGAGACPVAFALLGAAALGILHRR